MTDSQLAALVITALRAGGVAAPMPIKQNNQPSTRGRPSGPCVLFEKIMDRRYGSTQRTDAPDPDEEFGVLHVETQVLHTTFQINALAEPVGADGEPPVTTASDLVNLAAAAIQSDAAIAHLLAQGVGVFRVTDVRNPAFMNDQGQFERVPSFDFVLTHDQIMISKAPAAEIDALAVVHV